METPDYSKMTKAQLLAHPDARGCYYLSMNHTKASIIEAIKLRQQIEKDTVERAIRTAHAEAEHRITRETVLRQQSNVDPKDLEYPFSHVGSGRYRTAHKSIPGQNSVDVGDFPDNIEHYYWIRPGCNDVAPWMTLCRLTNGAYVFYKGECSYTGFSCQGDMELYSSMDPAILITYAMSISDYNDYIKDTSSSV